MIQINPLKSYIDGGVRAALTTPPSASLVFDLPGKAIWVKGVKLKGTDHTYTFSHDNYITLTNTPDSNESEDIKIGVNTSALKSAIDTTYGVVSTTANGLAPKFTSGNKLAAAAATTYYFLGWAGTTLKWYQAPFRNVRINAETTDCLGVNNTDPLIISSGNGISVTWDSTNKKIIITNTKPDINHNTDTKVALSVTTLNKNYAIILKGNDSDEGSITTVNFSTYLKFNPSTKQLTINGSKVITTIDTFVGATTSADGSVGLVTKPLIANRLLFLRGDGTWATPVDTWRPVKVEGTEKLGSNALDLSAGNGISIVYNSDTKKIIITNTKPDVNHNTHYTTMLYIGENNDTKVNKNIANPYLKLFDDNARRATFQIKAGNGIAVASDANGNITITNSSPDINHNTDERVRQVPKTDNINRPLMMINGNTSTGEQINTSMFSTGIYANASTKMITANGFIKAGSSNDYVLLGGGGHKMESSLSVNYAASAGSASSATQATNLRPENTAHYFRDPTSSTWRGGMFWGSNGNESMSFVVAHTNTRFQFVGGSDIANWTSSTWQSVTPYLTIYSSGIITPGSVTATNGFIKSGSSNSYILLGGGGHKALSDFSMAHTHPYLPLAGGTLSGSLIFKYGGNNSDQFIQFSSTDSSDSQTVYLGIRRPLSSFGLCYKDNNGKYYLLFHDGNYTTYTVKKDGTGASGTWNISITGNANTVDNIHATGFLRWKGMLNIGSNAPFQAVVDIMKDTSKLNDGGLAFYSYAGDEYTVLIGSRNDATRHGNALKWGYANKYLWMIRMTDGSPKSSDWEKISAGYADSAGNADTVDGQHFSYSNSSNSPTYLWASNSNGSSFLAARASISVNYASSAENADTVDSLHATRGNNKPWGTIPAITTNGWMDVGKQFEFHYDNTTGSDYSTALICTGNYSNVVNLPSTSGTLALTSQLPTKASWNYDDRYLKLSGGWMNWNAQIYFKGLNESTSVYSKIGYATSASGQTMHCVNTAGHQANGAFYITTNGSTNSNDTGGLAIDNEGVTVFGAGDPGSNFTGVFRVLNEDNVADGPQFLVTKNSGCTCKYSFSTNAGHITVAAGYNLRVNGTGGDGYGLCLYGSDTTPQNYGIWCGLGSTYGNMINSSDWNMYFGMNGDKSRSWIWRHTDGTLAAQLTSEGTFNAKRILINNATYSSDSLVVGGAIRVTGVAGGGHAGGVARRVYFGDGSNACIGEYGNGEDTDKLWLRGYHSIYFETNTGSATYDNNFTIPGSFYANSDIRYKLIQTYLLNKINLIAKLPIFTYYWNDNLHDNKLHIGSSAQAVNKIFPELVTYDKSKDFYNLDYATLGTIAGITACKELVTLKSELQLLKEKVKLLEDKLRKYENTL